MSLITVLVILIIVGVSLYLVRLIPMDAVVQKIITALVILAVILWLLEGFGLFAGYGHSLRMHP